MPPVILRAIRLAVMAKPHVMSNFMRRRFGHVRFVAAQIVRVNPAGPVGCITGTTKHVHITDAPGARGWIRRAVGVGRTRDQSVSGAGGKGGWPLGGDVDVEWRIILRHPFPNPLNRGLLSITISREIRVGAERQ